MVRHRLVVNIDTKKRESQAFSSIFFLMVYRVVMSSMLVYIGARFPIILLHSLLKIWVITKTVGRFRESDMGVLRLTLGF